MAKQPRRSKRGLLKQLELPKRSITQPNFYKPENFRTAPIQKLIKNIKIARQINVSRMPKNQQKIYNQRAKKAREVVKSLKTFKQYYSSRGTNDITSQVEFTRIDSNVSSTSDFFYLMAADIKHDIKSLEGITSANDILDLVFKQNFGDKAEKPTWMTTETNLLRAKGSLESDVQKKFKNGFEKEYDPEKLSVSDILKFDTFLNSKLFVAFDQASQGGSSTHLFGKNYARYLITPAQWMDAGRHYAPPQSQGGESFYYADKGITFTIRTSDGKHVIFGGKITNTDMRNVNGVAGLYRVELTKLFGQPLENEPKEFYVEGKGGAQNNYLNKFFGDFAQILYCLAFKVEGRNNSDSPKLYWQTGDKIAQMMYLFMAKSYKKEPALIAEIGQDSKTLRDRTLILYMPKGGRENIIKRNLEQFRKTRQPNTRVNYRSNNENKKPINPNFAKSFREELTKYFNKNSSQLTLRDVSRFAQKVHGSTKKRGSNANPPPTQQQRPGSKRGRNDNNNANPRSTRQRRGLFNFF